MTTLNWDTASQVAWFRHGLRDEVKDLLVGCDLPQPFDDFVQLCIRLDNAWRARQQEKKSNTASSSNTKKPAQTGAKNSATTATSTGTHPGPMDLAASRHRGPLTDAEKAYRRANNLCSYCGKPGHYAAACPATLKKGKAKANASASNSASPAVPATIVSSADSQATSSTSTACVLYSSPAKN